MGSGGACLPAQGHLRSVNGQHSPAQNREGRRPVSGTVRISLAGEPVTNAHAHAERLLFVSVF